MGIGSFFSRGRATAEAKLFGDVDAVKRGAANVVVFDRKFSAIQETTIDNVKKLVKAIENGEETAVTLRNNILNNFKTMQSLLNHELNGTLYIVSGWTKMIGKLHQDLEYIEIRLRVYETQGLRGQELVTQISDLHSRIREENKELLEGGAKAKTGRQVFGRGFMNKRRDPKKLAAMIKKNADRIEKLMKDIEEHKNKMEEEAADGRGKSTKEEIKKILEAYEEIEKKMLEDIRKEYLTLMLKTKKNIVSQKQKVDSKAYRQLLGHTYNDIVKLSKAMETAVTSTLAQAVDMLRTR